MICKECGGPSEKAYCSKLCANRFWKKSPGFLNKKCLICGEPCHNSYCSYTCKASTLKKEHKENCLTCGKEFIFSNIAYKKRGGMKYCSYKCAHTIYKLDETFFTHYSDIPLIYQTLGFLFATARVQDYGTHDIDVRATKEELVKFSKIVSSTYKITSANGFGNGHKNCYRVKIKSKIWLDYLDYIGFNNILATHTFPIILEEYRLDFIKGYVKTDMCEIHKKDNYTLYIIKGYSYHLIRCITDFLKAEMATKQLEYCCIFKDFDNILS